MAIFSMAPPAVNARDPVGSIRALTNYVSNMQENIDYAMTQMRKDHQALASTVEKQGSAIGALQGQLSTAQSGLSAVRGQVSSMSGRLSGLEGRVAALEKG